MDCISFTVYGYGATYTRLSSNPQDTEALHASIDAMIQAGAKEITISARRVQA